MDLHGTAGLETGVQHASDHQGQKCESGGQAPSPTCDTSDCDLLTNSIQRHAFAAGLEARCSSTRFQARCRCACSLRFSLRATLSATWAYIPQYGVLYYLRYNLPAILKLHCEKCFGLRRPTNTLGAYYSKMRSSTPPVLVWITNSKRP